ALELSDRVAVMDSGSITQLGPPESVYRNPATASVARFVGSVNELPGTGVQTKDQGVAIKTSWGVLHSNHAPEGVIVGHEAVAMIRPEAVRISVRNGNAPDRGIGTPDGVTRLTGVIQNRIFCGAYCDLLIGGP